jgi:hypothetical protein
MRPFGILKISVALLGLGAVFILAPACKAQEVNPDHFTATGIEGVNPIAPNKVAPSPKQTPSPVQARNHQSDATATLQFAAKRDSSLPAQPAALVIQEKRKPTPSLNPKKPQ